MNKSVDACFSHSWLSKCCGLQQTNRETWQYAWQSYWNWLWHSLWRGGSLRTLFQKVLELNRPTLLDTVYHIINKIWDNVAPAWQAKRKTLRRCHLKVCQLKDFRVQALEPHPAEIQPPRGFGQCKLDGECPVPARLYRHCIRVLICPCLHILLSWWLTKAYFTEVDIISLSALSTGQDMSFSTEYNALREARDMVLWQ